MKPPGMLEQRRHRAALDAARGEIEAHLANAPSLDGTMVLVVDPKSSGFGDPDWLADAGPSGFVVMLLPTADMHRTIDVLVSEAPELGPARARVRSPLAPGHVRIAVLAGRSVGFMDARFVLHSPGGDA